MSDHETIEMEPYAAPPPPPKRIQLSRAKGYRKPEDAIVVARPSKWGNPYRVVKAEGGWRVEWDGGTTIEGLFPTRQRASAIAIEGYRLHLRHTAAERGLDPNEVRGHDLACWCPLTDGDGNPWPCHADVLLALSNR